MNIQKNHCCLDIMICVEIFKLHFLLLIPSSLSLLDSEVTLVKTVGKESDFTPICTNETSNIIIMIVCKIRTKRNNREQCSLLYRDGGDFVHECDSRFSLKTRNQTVFLHLTGLTAADSGNYSCQCANLDGPYFLHLRIIVNESFPNDNPADEVWSQSAGVTLPSALTAAVLLVIIVSVILGFIHRRRPHRGCLRSETSGSSVHGPAAAVDEDTSDKLYSSLQQQTRDIYQTVSSGRHQYKTETKVTDELENMEMTRNCNIYENILN